LLLLSLALGVKENVVDRTFAATHDSLLAILIHEVGLVVHHDLLLQFEVSLAKDEDLALTSNVHILSRADCSENFNSLVFAVDSSDAAKVIR